MAALASLDRELSLLEAEFYPVLGSSTESIIDQKQQEVTTKQTIALRFMFNGLAFDLHTRLTYPWCAGVSAARNDAQHHFQMLRSQSYVLDTCRNTTLLLRHISLDASTPLL